MKKVLRSLLGFLERKFPDKVVVTESSYRLMLDALSAQAKNMTDCQERLAKVEQNLLNVNQSLGFAVPKFGLLER